MRSGAEWAIQTIMAICRPMRRESTLQLIVLAVGPVGSDRDVLALDIAGLFKCAMKGRQRDGCSLGAQCQGDPITGTRLRCTSGTRSATIAPLRSVRNRAASFAKG